jgi:glycosyltransferase involved in cell wall biosynthesis
VNAEYYSLGDLTVVVPVRNAAGMLADCLDSIVRQRPAEIVVVDGNSTDTTLELARRYEVTILSDEGRGLPVARLLGVRAAVTPHVALVDADVVLPDGALARLLTEYLAGGYTALQAGLNSVGGPGYWGRALAQHHRSGRSKTWFGLVATIFDRDTLLEIGFDERFLSGEDIELRWRLIKAGH